MSVPGPVRNLQLIPGNATLFALFNAPIYDPLDVDAGLVSYGYSLIVDGGIPSAAVLWNMAYTNVGVISIPITSSSGIINNGSAYQIRIIPSNTYGTAAPGDQIISAPATPLGSITSSTFTESINDSGTSNVVVSDAVVQTGTVTDTLIYPDLQQGTTSISSYSVVPPNQSSISVGNVDLTNPLNSQLTGIAAAAASAVGGTVLGSASISASAINFGKNVEQTSPVSIQLSVAFSSDQGPLAAASGISVSVSVITNEVPISVGSVSATYNSSTRTLTTSTPFSFIPKSVYIFIYTLSNGTTITVPVENNQAYNNYLHDESGYQNRRENRLLTSGYYRGPVDSSTLTRIRAANGVLLGIPGVPGGMQGSRCCP